MAELSLNLGEGDNISWPAAMEIFFIKFFDVVVVHQKDA